MPRLCVGAFIRDERNRVYLHRRSPHRRLLPGIWDAVGGHVEPGETPEVALAREIEEETGWRLATIEAQIAEWEWDVDGEIRHEIDYLVRVDGDLQRPRLEAGKHDAYAWIGPGELELLMVGRADGDRRLRDIVAKATRIRLTDRLRLEPVGREHADDLVRLHADADVAFWYGGAWRHDEAVRNAVQMNAAWETSGVHKWVAYDRRTGELVGRGGLSRMDRDSATTRQIAALLRDSPDPSLAAGGWEPDRLELGWALLSSQRSRGFATEIGRAGLSYGFDDLNARVIVAYTERHNVRSRAVMERLGMRWVGEIVASGLIEGQAGVHDSAPFAVYATSPGTSVESAD